MGGLRRSRALGAPRGDGVHVDVEDALVDRSQLGQAGLLLGFLPGHPVDVGIAIGVAARLKPEPQFSMMKEHHLLRRHVQDPRRAGDVSGEMAPLETLRGAPHENPKALEALHLGGVEAGALGMGVEEGDEGSAGVAHGRSDTRLEPKRPDLGLALSLSALGCHPEEVLALLGLFIFLPAFELYLLIVLGTEVGALNTLLIILVTGTIGAALVRQQGLGVLQRIQVESESGRLPAIELVEGLVLLVAGALLVTPGLLTDAAGFLALVAPLRRRAAEALAARVVMGAQSQIFRVQMPNPGFGGRGPTSRPSPDGAPPPAGTVIDVESRPLPPTNSD